MKGFGLLLLLLLVGAVQGLRAPPRFTARPLRTRAGIPSKYVAGPLRPWTVLAAADEPKEVVSSVADAVAAAEKLNAAAANDGALVREPKCTMQLLLLQHFRRCFLLSVAK